MDRFLRIRDQWLTAIVVAVGVFVSFSASGERSAADGGIRGVNMRLVPYLDITSTTPAGELIRLNSARLDLAQKAGFAEVDRRGQAVVGAAARSPVRAVVAGVRSGGAHAAGRARRTRRPGGAARKGGDGPGRVSDPAVVSA